MYALCAAISAATCIILLLKIGSRQVAIKDRREECYACEVACSKSSLPRVGMKVVYPQVLFRGGRQPFRGNNREWYPREASGRAHGLRVLERMVIMERCILTMFITEGARHHNSLSALRAFLSWNFSRRGYTYKYLHGAFVSLIDNAQSDSRFYAFDILFKKCFKKCDKR